MELMKSEFLLVCIVAFCSVGYMERACFDRKGVFDQKRSKGM